MADLASHLLVNYIAGVRFLDRSRLPFLVTGALLPDLASRVPRVLLTAAVEVGWIEPTVSTYRAMLGLDFPHTPVGVVLCAGLVALLLPTRLAAPPGRRAVSTMLCFGGFLHLAVDSLQVHLMPGYRYLYPLSIEAFELGWISTEHSLAAIPLLAGIAWFLGRRSKGERQAPVNGSPPPSPRGQ